MYICSKMRVLFQCHLSVMKPSWIKHNRAFQRMKLHTVRHFTWDCFFCAGSSSSESDYGQETHHYELQPGYIPQELQYKWANSWSDSVLTSRLWICGTEILTGSVRFLGLGRLENKPPLDGWGSRSSFDVLPPDEGFTCVSLLGP